MDVSDATTHHLTVPRTARYVMHGDVAAAETLWIALHGYRQRAESVLSAFTELDHGRPRCAVAPEALSRFYIDGMDGRVGASWMTTAERAHEIGDALAYLNRLYAHLRKGDSENTTTCLLGFSQGAEMASRWLARGTATVDRLVLWAGGIPPDLDLETHASAFQSVRLTLVLGTNDEYIALDDLHAFEARLDDHTIPYETITFDGTHQIDPDVLRQVVGGENVRAA